MSHYALLIILLALISDSFASVQTEQEALSKLLQVLRQQGFHALSSSEQPAPLIPSQWWVNGLKDSPQKQLEQSRHDFGTQLVSALNKEAERLKTLTDSAQRVEAVEHLLNFSDWIAHPGYGNLFLHARTQNLAAVPMAYLTADLSYPESKIAQFIGHFRNYNMEPEIQVEALNREFGEAHFSVATSNPIGQETWMNSIWGKGMIEGVRQWRKENSIDRRLSNVQVRPQMPKTVAFFVDDKFHSMPQTVTGLWKHKWHHRVALGISENRLLQEVKALLLYRQKVGRFPKTPSPDWEKYHDTPLESAFFHEWRAFLFEGVSTSGNAGKHASTYAIAAEIYERVINNKVMEKW